MFKARLDGKECEVRVTRDISENWAVEFAPVFPSPRRWEPHKPDPAALVVKLRADTAEAALKAAVEIVNLKQKKVELLGA